MSRNVHVDVCFRVKFLSHFTGGLLCFTMRDVDVAEYEEKMLELEKAGRWQSFSKEVIPFSDNEDLPQETNRLIFRVLKN